MAFEEAISKWLTKAPEVVVSAFWAFLFTGCIFVFVFFAKALDTIPRTFDLPWLLIFFSLFFIVLIRRRVIKVRKDQRPALA